MSFKITVRLQTNMIMKAIISRYDADHNDYLD